MALSKITVAEYAQSAQAEGARVIRKGGVWWREVRPFFFRPLLPFLEHELDVQLPSFRAAIGGFQHVVPSVAAANSRMEFLVFPDAPNYAVSSLHSTRRWEVRAAARRFSVRPIVERDEFRGKAHPVYVSFYERTRYSHFTARFSPKHFSRWAESIYHQPGPMVLGAFEGAELAAVSISRAIGDTLLLSTFFARSDGLHHHVASLMLHAVRTAAAESGDIRTVFAGMRKAGRAQPVDEFYLHRGCTIQALPARLIVNPIVRLAMRAFSPGVLRHLSGERGP